MGARTRTGPSAAARAGDGLAGVWTRGLARSRSPRLRRTLSASAGTVLGGAAGALLPFLVARWFEIGRSTDVYFLVVGAVQLVAYMLALVVESAVLPFAAKALQADRHALRPFSRTMARYVLVAGVPVTAVALLVVAFFLLPVAGLPRDAATMTYLWAVAPLPLLAALSGVASAANFALDRFAFTTGTQVLRAGGGIAMAAALGPHWGLPAVALGLTLGEALRALLLALAIPRTPKGVRPRPVNVGVQMLRLASPTLLASIVIAVNPIVDKTVAARLDAGATTIIELAEKAFYIPMVLLVAGVTKVSATVWARHVDVDDTALRRDFWRVQRGGALVTTGVVVIAIPTVLLSRGLVAGFLGVDRDSAFFAVLVVLIVGLPLALAADLATAMLVTLRRTRSFPAVAVVLVLANLGLDIVGAHLFGVVGIAVSTTVVRVVNVAAFVWLCHRYLGERRPVLHRTQASVTTVRDVS